MGDVDLREILEACGIPREHRATRRARRRRDDEVVGSTRATSLPSCREQHGMSPGDFGVVGEHRHRLQDIVHERLPRRPLSGTRQAHPDQQLSDGNGGDGNVIAIGDQRVEFVAAALDIDQEGRVQQQPGQGRFSTDNNLRISTTSSLQSGSGW